MFLRKWVNDIHRALPLWHDEPVINTTNKLTTSWSPPNIITVTSHWAWWRLKSLASGLFAQKFVQEQMKEYIKAPRHWFYVGGIHCWSVDSPHKGSETRKMFPFDDVFMKIYSMKRHVSCGIWSMWHYTNSRVTMVDMCSQRVMSRQKFISVYNFSVLTSRRFVWFEWTTLELTCYNSAYSFYLIHLVVTWLTFYIIVWCHIP